MTKEQTRKDLVVLVADKDMEEPFLGLLFRHHALQVRALTLDVFRHPYRDPGCLRQCRDFLRPFVNRYSFALVVFDREGCGREKSTRIELEQETENTLSKSGWGSRTAAIVLDPSWKSGSGAIPRRLMKCWAGLDMIST